MLRHTFALACLVACICSCVAVNAQVEAPLFRPVQRDTVVAKPMNLFQPRQDIGPHKQPHRHDHTLAEPKTVKGRKVKKSEIVTACPGNLHACALPSGSFECRESHRHTRKSLTLIVVGESRCKPRVGSLRRVPWSGWRSKLRGHSTCTICVLRIRFLHHSYVSQNIASSEA